jgi:DNA (cytosine-5)-methyltransferase 1
VEKEYFVDHEKLNSLDFGVPQHRERVFFVGIRKDCLDKKKIEDSIFGKWFPFPVNKKYQNAATKYNWGKQVEFGKNLTKPEDVPIYLCVEDCLVLNQEINETPNADEFFNLYIAENILQSINEGETNRPSFKRLHRFKFSPTTCYGNNEVHLHPYLHRRLSVREALRIQGVPDEYALPKELPMSKKFKMIGNGVPVPLAEAVATPGVCSMRGTIVSSAISRSSSGVRLSEVTIRLMIGIIVGSALKIIGACAPEGI